jgi:beta propeller repeat protein
MKTWFFKAFRGTALMGSQILDVKFLPNIVGLWAALLVITVLPGSAFAQGPIEVLEEFTVSPVDNFGFQAISGDVVVFDKNNNIYSYELSTDTGFRITAQGVSGWPDISGDTIVWMDQRNGNWDIYGYDLSEGKEFPITSHAAHQKWPVIDGNTVVWVDWRNGGDGYGYDLYRYDLASGTEFPISGHSAPIACPAISGNVVVWSEHRYGGWDIYGYDLSSATETQITHWGISSSCCPAISSGVIVLGGGNSVGGFDLSGNLLFETPTLFYPFYDYSRPAIDGNLVVWQERDPSLIVCLTYPCDSTIVGYEVTSRHKFLIPRGDHEAWYPAVSGHVVVWRDYSTASEITPPPPTPSVYASKLLETVQLSVSSQFVDPGDVLTYTIALAEATTTSHKRITDSLSSFVTLDVPSLSVTSGNYGYDPATHVVTWTGDVSSENPITITYNVMVSLDASLREHITNTAIISDQTSVFSRTASTWVAHRTYLPIIVKSYSP